MTPPPTCSALDLYSLRVSAKSEWLFVELRCSDGHIGFGEATMEGHESAVKLAVAELARLVEGKTLTPGPVTGALRSFALGNPARYTAISALEQAIWDAEGKRRGVPLGTLLGAKNISTRLYANINRCTEDRTPEGFVAKAAAAVADGFGALKIAPFDGLDWTGGHSAGHEHLYQQGLERIDAIRRAIGNRIDLMIDCHWRFDPDTAARLIKDVSQYGLYWIECPIAETPQSIPEVTALRGLCNDQGTKLAGLEALNGLEQFLPWLEAAALDVIMPDVKYAGGIGECRRIAQAADLHGTICSPHNPTGPVCHAASLHLAAGLSNCPILEHQYAETPLFHDLVAGCFPPLKDGRASPPSGPGLGIELILPDSVKLVDTLSSALQH